MSKRELKEYDFKGIRITYIPGRYGSSYLLCGESSAVLIEAGSAADLPLYQKAIALADRELSGIICTHEHLDHILGLEAASRVLQVPVYAGPYTAEVLGGKQKFSIPPLKSMRMLPLTWIFQGAPLPSFVDWKILGGLIFPFTPPWRLDCLRILEEGDSLEELGFPEWEVLIFRGHSPEDLCLYNRSQGLLFSGDIILSYRGGEFNAMMNDKSLYGQTVERLSGYPVSSVFPGHGQPVHDETGLLSDYISSVEERGLINKTGNGIRNSVK